MSEENHRLFEIFWDVQRGLPRQGPGSDESTLKALALCTGLPEQLALLDIGCGPGMQTVALAKALAGSHITAVDIHREYLDELKERAKAARVAECIHILAGDMQTLPFPPQHFDLIWAEGAAYIMGFEEALVAWKRFLKAEGYIAVSELVWLRSSPPTEVAEFFGREYPAMTDIETIMATIRTSGYEPRGHFTLPDAAWWESYYTPLEAKLPSLYNKYAADEKALSMIEIAKREIDLRRRFGSWYGYEFFVGQRVESSGSP
jgi:ubiquinone/menaquinone biosynthesis C-methylase UbiE